MRERGLGRWVWHSATAGDKTDEQALMSSESRGRYVLACQRISGMAAGKAAVFDTSRANGRRVKHWPKTRKHSANSGPCKFAASPHARSSFNPPEDKKLQSLLHERKRKANFGPISQCVKATRKRFPHQNLSRKEPFMPRKLLPVHCLRSTVLPCFLSLTPVPSYKQHNIYIYIVCIIQSTP